MSDSGTQVVSLVRFIVSMSNAVQSLAGFTANLKAAERAAQSMDLPPEGMAEFGKLIASVEPLAAQMEAFLPGASREMDRALGKGLEN